MAITKKWNDGWGFLERKLSEEAYQLPAVAEWKPVDLPHDWMIYDTHALYRDSCGWYRKEFHIEKQIKEEQILLRFDGVYMDSTVYINGKEAGSWKYGYSTFEIDITPFLVTGKNEILVRVVYKQPNTRWYSGAGIYRNVWWKVRKKSHIVSDGIYVTPVRETEECWRVEADVELCLAEGEKTEADRFQVKQQLFDPDNRLAAEHNERLAGKLLVNSAMTVESPVLWDVGQGKLYRLHTELWKEDELYEQEDTLFGFRSFLFSPEEGFSINGRHMKIYGVCEHHDLGCLGAAFSRPAMERRLVMLREMGVNAIRTSHNMPAPELMDLADEMGILILSEAFDMWEKPKTAYDYSCYFNDWYERDIASWVRRDRNHPSLLMWSIGNEIQDVLTEGRGNELTRLLRDAVRRHDPKNHAPVTHGSNYMKWENPQLCSGLLDCQGYNYSEYLYDAHHKRHKEWVIYGSETSSVLASRGIYHFPADKAVLTDEDEQCSALGNSITGWGADSYEACICDDRDAVFSLGQFIWTGFDYIGESTPYQTKNSYFGQIDTAGFPKDSFYIFQAEWTDYRSAPMVHVFPYWDFNEGQNIDIQVCSNAPVVELFVNGKSQGLHHIDHIKGRRQVGRWRVPYEKGELKAVAYDEQGNVIAEEIRRSFSDPVVIQLKADKQQIKADGEDMAFVEVSVFDQQGNPVENANNRINVTVTGAGRLIGIENGDSTDFDAYKGKSKRLFGGKLLAVIGAKQEAGEITVICTSPGLAEGRLLLQAENPELKDGISALEENSDYPIYAGGPRGNILENGQEEIPVRKIELRSAGQVLTKEENSMLVEAALFPENAVYDQLEWRAVNDSGIEVNFIQLERDGNRARVTALGEGRFRLRCSCKNGGSCSSVVSSLEMEAIGMGAALLNPYEEIPAGLCGYRSQKAGEGVSHGIGFSGSDSDKREGVIGFEHVDFGDYGSDSMILPIFANTNDPVTFQIWEGKPEQEGSTLLADCFYHKPPRWMEFQEETYLLKKRLKGVTSLYFATGDAFVLRGFSVQKQEKAFSRLCASECSKIYGDAYTIKEERVEQIGNNVILEFEHMDFGDKGTERFKICSRSERSMNPVQIRFTSDMGSCLQIVELPGSREYQEQTFSIEPLKGAGKVEFVFLPGSSFDFWWFEFCECV